jgi:hypothetical protein
VVAVPVPSLAVRDGTALEWKREAIWHNPDRNQLIARLVEALTAGDRKALRKLGVVLDRKPLPPRPAIAILVEGAEHGRALQGYLRAGYELLQGEAEYEANPKIDTPARGTIVTQVRAATGGVDADIIIRADGDGGTLVLRKFPPRADEGRKDIRLIDIADLHDGGPTPNIRRRLHAYEDQGLRLLTTVHELHLALKTTIKENITPSPDARPPAAADSGDKDQAGP